MVKESNSCEQLFEIYTLIHEWEDFENRMIFDIEKNCLMILAKKAFLLDSEGIHLFQLLELMKEETFPLSLSKVLVSKYEDADKPVLAVKIILKLNMESEYECPSKWKNKFNFRGKISLKRISLLCVHIKLVIICLYSLYSYYIFFAPELGQTENQSRSKLSAS